MRIKMILAAALGLALTIPASAQIGVGIDHRGVRLHLGDSDHGRHHYRDHDHHYRDYDRPRHRERFYGSHRDFDRRGDRGRHHGRPRSGVHLDLH